MKSQFSSIKRKRVYSSSWPAYVFIHPLNVFVFTDHCHRIRYPNSREIQNMPPHFEIETSNTFLRRSPMQQYREHVKEEVHSLAAEHGAGQLSKRARSYSSHTLYITKSTSHQCLQHACLISMVLCCQTYERVRSVDIVTIEAYWLHDHKTLELDPHRYQNRQLHFDSIVILFSQIGRSTVG